MIPTWLASRLGAPTPRGVVAERCRDCKAHILTGLDDDVAAIRASVDPTPLTAMGEAIALLGGRTSYALKAHKTGFALWCRDQWQISGERPKKADIVATHKCGESFQAFQTASVLHQPIRVAQGGADDPPPF